MKPRLEIRVSNHPGIFKILVLDKVSSEYTEPNNGCRYRVVKSIKGHRTTRSFKTLREAVSWKNTASLSNPVIEQKVIAIAPLVKQPLFGDMYRKYQDCMFPSYEVSTLEYKKNIGVFFDEFSTIPMDAVNPDLLDRFILNKKRQAIINGSKRCSFENELRELRTFFNWYRENGDYKFSNPVLKRHSNLGFIRKPVKKNKKMTSSEVNMFLNSLKKNCPQVYYDMAVVQFYTAGRIGEIAGLQKKCIDFKNESLKIQYTTVWNKNKEFVCLKDKPKNGKPRFCTIVEPMKESLSRQIEASVAECGYVFQVNGEPIPYRLIQLNYNKALRKCGLGNKYSSTHFLRHSMASITRYATGSLDSTQAVTGHSDIEMVQHYAGTPDNRQKEAVIKVLEFMKKDAA